MPETFDETDVRRGIVVRGERSDTAASIGIEETLPEEGESAIRYTDITVARSPDDVAGLTKLEVDRYITDDVGELHGAASRHKTFTPGASDNDLSLFRVMRCTDLALQTVEGVRTLEYLSRPSLEHDYSQTL